MSWYILVALCFFIGSSYTGQTFDTVFLVDSSSSVRDKDKYDLIRRFVVNLTMELVNTHKHRVGIISFSGVVYRVILKLTDNQVDVHNGMKALNKTGGFSYVTDALNYVIAKMFNKSIHIGDGKQIITVLGGNPDNYDAITKMAKNLKSRGLEMYSVGIGPDFFKSTKTLRTLASLPIKDHTLRTTYKSLLKSTPIMLKKLKKDMVALVYRRKKQRKVRKNNYIYRKVRKAQANANTVQNSARSTQRPSEPSISNAIASTEDTNHERKPTSRAASLLLDYFGSGVSTVHTPNTASPDMGTLISSNSTEAGGTPTCVGSVPLANRVLTNGTMITGIVPTYTNTSIPSTARACDPSLALEEGISTGDSGIDATWDYGK